MAKAKDKVTALYGIGDHVWVPCRSTISKNGLFKSSDDQTSSSTQTVKITCDKIRYWPAKIISVLFTGNRQLFSFIRVMSKDNSLSKTPSVTRYLVKLVGLDITQEFLEQALKSWDSFDPKPLPDVSISFNFNLFKKQLSDLSSYEIIALYVYSVRKVSKEIELTMKARDRDSITSIKNVKRVKIYHDEKGIKDSMNNLSQSSRSKKGKKGTSAYAKKKSLPKKSLANSSFSVDSNSKTAVIETHSSKESMFNSNSSKDIPETTHFKDKLQKHAINNYNDSNNNALSVPIDSRALKTKFIKSIGYVTIDNNLFRTTRRGKVFGKWRPSKKSRLSEDASMNEKKEIILSDNFKQEVVNVSKHKNKENPCILQTTKSHDMQQPSINVEEKVDMTSHNIAAKDNVHKVVNAHLKYNGSTNDSFVINSVVQDAEPKSDHFEDRSQHICYTIQRSLDDNTDMINDSDEKEDDTESMEVDTPLSDDVKTELEINTSSASITSDDLPAEQVVNVKELSTNPTQTKMQILNRKSDIDKKTPVSKTQTLKQNFDSEKMKSHESDGCESITDVDEMEKDSMETEMVEQQVDENSVSVFSSPLQSFRSAMLGFNIFSWSSREKSFLK
ncbi:8753_t:CDS:2 [Racocetra persica]|uniref:8753_t:CDS:1 n=1 Tax=Racocetra persica TaxID=160502 RepID=A0ACA9LCS8_9GLOM|nr:8753_t:CDS:2 [Racocetra persica]